MSGPSPPEAAPPATCDGGRAVASALGRHRKWLVGGLCVLVIGAPLTVNAFGSTFRAGFQVWCLILGLIVLAEPRLASLVLEGRPRSVVAPLAALWAYLLIRALGSLDPPAALIAVLDRTALVVVMVILASGVIGEDRYRVVVAGLAGMVVVAIWGIAQRVGIHPFLDPAIWEPGRPRRPLGTHNLMGGYLGAWLPVATAVALGARGWRKLVWGAVALLDLAAFLLVESRGAWLAMVVTGVAIVIWLLFGGARRVARVARRDRRGWQVLLAIAVVVTVVCAGPVVARLSTRERSGVLNTVSGPGDPVRAAELTSFERRKLVGETALALVGRHPAWGTGPGSFRLAFLTARPPLMQRLEAETRETASHAHWDALEVAVELGLAGLAMMAVWLGAALVRALAAIDPRQSGDSEGATGDRAARRDAPGQIEERTLIEAGIVFGGLALGFHGLIDFSLHEVPTALVGAVFLGLAAGERGARRPQGSGPAFTRLIAAVVLAAGIAAAVATGISEAAYRKAYDVLSAGDLDGSERWLRRGLALSPDKARDWVALGEVARHRARFAKSPADRQAALIEAAARFETAARIEPEFGRRWLRLAGVLNEAREAGAEVDIARLKAHVERAIEDNPYLIEGQVWLARLARESGDLDEAARVLETASRVAPEDSRLALERGRVLLASGDAKAAVAAFAEAAVTSARESPDADAASEEALDELASMARGAVGPGVTSAAADSVLDALAARGGRVASGAARRLGDVALGDGDHDSARAWYARAEALGSSPEIRLGLGNLAYAEGSLDEAERHYRAALASRPDMPEALQNLGNVAVARGDTALARRLYGRALELRPENEALRAYVAALARPDSAR